MKQVCRRQLLKKRSLATTQTSHRLFMNRNNKTGKIVRTNWEDRLGCASKSVGLKNETIIGLKKRKGRSTL